MNYGHIAIVTGNKCDRNDDDDNIAMITMLILKSLRGVRAACTLTCSLGLVLAHSSAMAMMSTMKVVLR